MQQVFGFLASHLREQQGLPGEVLQRLKTEAISVIISKRVLLCSNNQGDVHDGMSESFLKAIKLLRRSFQLRRRKGSECVRHLHTMQLSCFTWQSFVSSDG
jgi:hypothetical protein